MPETWMTGGCCMIADVSLLDRGAGFEGALGSGIRGAGCGATNLFQFRLHLDPDLGDQRQDVLEHWVVEVGGLHLAFPRGLLGGTVDQLAVLVEALEREADAPLAA